MLVFNNKHIFAQTYMKSCRLDTKHLTCSTNAATTLHPMVESLLQIGPVCGQDTLWPVYARHCLEE